MFISRKKIHRQLVVTSTTLMLAMAYLLPAAYARPAVPGGPIPAGHAIIHVGALAYLFLDGVFYRHGPRGYVVVPAPEGALISTLPPGAVLLEIDGGVYYSSAGTYYKPVKGGYVVVPRPVKHTEPEFVIGKMVLVDVELLNVRSGPGLDHHIVQQIRKDTKVSVEAVSGEWYLIRLQNKNSGWIKSRYVTILASTARG